MRNLKGQFPDRPVWSPTEYELVGSALGCCCETSGGALMRPVPAPRYPSIGAVSVQTLLGMECVVHPRQISETMEDIGGLNSIIGDLVTHLLHVCISQALSCSICILSVPNHKAS